MTDLRAFMLHPTSNSLHITQISNYLIIGGFELL